MIEGVYQIINSNTLMKVGGVLERKDLGNILSDHVRFPPDRHRFIIEMMRKFELCFDFPDARTGC
jgi:internalin A